MTLNDIKAEVTALGFESEIENDTVFLTALRRALNIVYTERGVHKSVTIICNPVIPKELHEKIAHRGNDAQCFPINGIAYSFSVCGKGSFTVSDALGDIEYRFDTPLAYFRGFVSENAKITFSGEFCYTVYNLSVFECLPGDTEESIPYYRERVEYRISDYAPDFLSLAELPTDRRAERIECAELCGDTLILPYSFSGEVNLKYRSAPPTISNEDADKEIAIPREFLHLVSLLTASYVWLDDDVEKSQYYYSLYRDGIAGVKLYGTRCLNTEYKDVLRWA